MFDRKKSEQNLLGRDSVRGPIKGLEGNLHPIMEKVSSKRSRKRWYLSQYYDSFLISLIHI